MRGYKYYYKRRDWIVIKNREGLDPKYHRRPFQVVEVLKWFDDDGNTQQQLTINLYDSCHICDARDVRRAKLPEKKKGRVERAQALLLPEIKEI